MRSTTRHGIPTGGAEIADRLRSVRAELDLIARASCSELDCEESAQVAREVEMTTRACESLTNASVAGLEAAGSWAQSGARTFATWWTSTTHRRTSTSRAHLTTARRVRDDLPATARALAAGRIGGEHVQVLTRKATRTQALRDQLADRQMGEDFLVEQAERLPVEAFSRVVAAWAIRADPEAADRAWRDQGDAEEVHLSPTLDGYALGGWLSTEHGRVLDEAMRAVIGVPSAGDQRRPSQRRAGALVHLARRALDAGELQPTARVRPHIAVTIDASTLESLIAAQNPACDDTTAHTGPSGTVGAAGPNGTSRTAGTSGTSGTSHTSGSSHTSGTRPTGDPTLFPGDFDATLLAGTEPARWSDGSPISHGHAAKLLCNGEFHRVVFGPEGQILDSGRTSRLFTAAQTRAVIARDRHCQFPDCDAPPAQGEIHHSIWWYHQGRTSTDNAILLCWYHHDYVHQHHLTIESDPSGWRFTDPQGRIFGVGKRPSAPASTCPGDPPSAPLGKDLTDHPSTPSGAPPGAGLFDSGAPDPGPAGSDPPGSRPPDPGSLSSHPPGSRPPGSDPPDPGPLDLSAAAESPPDRHRRAGPRTSARGRDPAGRR